VETFTFLFTDIEGSTTAPRRLGDDLYAQVLADHHALVRAGLAAHGGEDGVWLVDLAAVPDGDAVPSAIAAALGFPGHRASRSWRPCSMPWPRRTS
jgi:class 3 adenylate cyclase